MISLVMPTRNRAHTIARAIASAIAQTHDDWELLIIDGASTDDTEAVVRALGEPRARFIREDHNRGVTAARNRGLDEARGDFIGMLDSDDELVPRALETLLAALDSVSARLDAISCNCIDGRTGKLTGRGLDHDRFLTVPLSLARARGEHWGIFHRRIVGTRRFNPSVRGYEGHLWMRIHDGALWYYLHQGLRIYHREGADRNTALQDIDYDLHRQIFDHDPELLRLYARWSAPAFERFVRIAAVDFVRHGDREHLERAAEALEASGAKLQARLLRAAMRLRTLSARLSIF